ncbi:CMP-sialic acid transporter 2 [Camellia lanceoleosa]|uniref:CMP-sialic acid transporter 2 n=1 Tax=Camellia lanceoleosa TaxID=1840588 RepID=A0ACC0IKX7_9ERIC|nr:CMP-sialic acid transporter 2 [Camellia lanceoleosa]
MVMRQRCIDRGALTLASAEVKFQIDTETHDPLDIGYYGVASLGGFAWTKQWSNADNISVEYPQVHAIEDTGLSNAVLESHTSIKLKPKKSPNRGVSFWRRSTRIRFLMTYLRNQLSIVMTVSEVFCPDLDGFFPTSEYTRGKETPRSEVKGGVEGLVCQTHGAAEFIDVIVAKADDIFGGRSLMGRNLLQAQKGITVVFISMHQFFSPLSKVKDEQQNGVVELKDVQDNHRYLLLVLSVIIQNAFISRTCLEMYVELGD